MVIVNSFSGTTFDVYCDSTVVGASHWASYLPWCNTTRQVWSARVWRDSSLVDAPTHTGLVCWYLFVTLVLYTNSCIIFGLPPFIKQLTYKRLSLIIHSTLSVLYGFPSSPCRHGPLVDSWTSRPSSNWNWHKNNTISLAPPLSDPLHGDKENNLHRSYRGYQEPKASAVK